MNFNNQVFNKWSLDANKELLWYSVDSELTYQDNLNSNYKQLQKNNWIDNSFTYKFNSNGFRCEEFTDTDSIVFLGCSITQGIGLPVDVIFPTLVAKKLNLQCQNLAMHGTSSDTAFRLASIYLKKLKPKIVISVLMFPHRTELLYPDNSFQFTGPWSMVGKYKLDAAYRKLHVEFYEKWLLEIENSQLNLSKNTLALQKMCANLNIKYINYGEKYYKNVRLETTLARDLIHPGIGFHNKFAELILSEL